MFVARAFSPDIAPMAGILGSAQSVPTNSTVTLGGWVEDPTQPVRIVNGTDFVMPADSVVNISLALTASSPSDFHASILLGSTVLVSSQQTPNVSVSNVAVREGDVVSIRMRNSNFVFSRQLNSGGTFAITPIPD